MGEVIDFAVLGYTQFALACPEVCLRGFIVSVKLLADRSDKEMMLRVLELARKGAGKASPNPMVGAVIVKSSEVVGEGWHLGVGKAHAEIQAIKKAGSKAKGSTLYVNLEPCCHVGKTGPCTEAIIAAGIKRVVYAIKDPDSRVNGKGINQLSKAGIKVTSAVLATEASLLNEVYLISRTNRRPFVILKNAQSIDGRIATSTGDSKWISSAQALKFGHQLRATVDAVVVGAKTVQYDDPALTVRLVKGRNPYRIILTSSLELIGDCQLLTKNSDQLTILVSTKKQLSKFKAAEQNGLIYWDLPLLAKSKLDLNQFLAIAYRFGLTSIMIEGGSQLATSFLKAGLVDKYISLISPIIVGEGVPSVGDLATNIIAESIKFSNISFEQCGPDMIFTGYPKRSR